MKLAGLVLAVLALLVPLKVGATGATFVAATTNPGATFTTAASFNTVAVTLADPGATLHGTVTLAATATSGRGIASVKYQSSPTGANTWTDACTATSAPYSCTLDTTALADGLRDFRAVATDTAGYTQTSAVVASRHVDNTAPTIALDAQPAAIRGTVTLTATTSDGNGTGVVSVAYQFRPAGTSSWLAGCTTTVAPYSCSADTTGIPDGLYSARAIATDGAGFTTISATSSGRVDNTAPATATLTNPGSPLSGTVTLSGSASDSGSGIASLAFQSTPAGTSNWTTACTATTAPYSCSWATAGTDDGLYDLRALATDGAGNTLVSAVVSSRRVDNDGPTVTLADPGSPLRAAVTLTATASDPSGVGSVTIQRKTTSGSTWTTVCTPASAPYSCAWATTGVADGSYDLRAIATDTLGHSTTSATVAARTVDNTPPAATDVQALNGTGTAGKMDTGDTLTFTYSEPLAPASILSGWSGAATAVTVRVNDAGSADTLAVYNAANTTRLNLTSATADLQLKADRTNSSGARFAATLTISGTHVVVTLGALSSGTSKTVTTTTPMVWTPSTAATDVAGNAVAATAVTERGTGDADF